ncbi:DUF2642 domain-containing protein [Paenibacillus sp. YPG26]|uniref:DUF2642 domain-containing protein n=1 Tax=Paenibacillus sp. YPG26 TaxID=2878915 RepID=UPI00203FFFC2|nr:DUF2642 domain-containing protein [Paenibacillus sp. YPG26]USB32147.1 DUF2642 domain-containing protein [Paenibacillus sp. YPG26]
MQVFKKWLNQTVELELSGCNERIIGRLIDIGSDILVLFSGSKFIYIPIHHLQNAYLSLDDLQLNDSNLSPSLEQEQISYRKMLMNSRGMFTAVSIGNKRSIHGYLTGIMNDYFVFYSPIYGSVYVSINHVKYLVPYPPNQTPFNLSQDHFPVQPAALPISRTLDQQIKKLEGELIVVNLGEKPCHAGLLRALDNNMLEMIDASGVTSLIHGDHIMTIHLPK